MPVQLTLDEGRVPVKIFTADVEQTAKQQLVKVS